MQPAQQPMPEQTGQIRDGSAVPRAGPAPRWLLWLIIGVVVLVVVGAVLAFVAIPYFAQPKVTLTGATYATAGCVPFGSPQWTYTWTFTLVNTGDADGFATVELYLNGQPNIGTFSTIVYLVPRGSQVTEQPAISSKDCGSYSPGATLLSVVKA